MRILIVDDEQGLRNSLNEFLKESFETFTAENGVKALEILNSKSIDIVLSDLKMPQLNGLELLQKVRESSPQTSFILMTAHGSIDGAVQAIQAGADDYISKPVEFTELLHRIEKLTELRQWQAQKSLRALDNKKSNIIGESAFIQDVHKFIVQVAKVPSPVLLLGPSGTGKEIVAKAIHEAAHSKEQTFVAVNCASLSENLVESELFGHEKGAFTGAVSAKPGKFELAAGGTIFLDEIGELPLGLQAKLLRVLQEKEFCRVGGTRQIKSQARVIAATHRNLKDLVAQGLFREDLYFRLNVLQYEMQPLAKRKEDLGLLIEHFWHAISTDLGIKSVLSEPAKKVLLAYSYPGNVRELKNMIERLIVLTPESGKVDIKNLPQELLQQAPLQPVAVTASHGTDSPENTAEVTAQITAHWRAGIPIDECLESFEKQIIHHAFEISNFNQVQTAELLGTNRGTLQYKIKKYEIDKKKAS
ncbi:MAG: sigma-54-dependent transcriptional regulator [Pseudobdellovibrio sp.]